MCRLVSSFQAFQQLRAVSHAVGEAQFGLLHLQLGCATIPFCFSST